MPDFNKFVGSCLLGAIAIALVVGLFGIQVSWGPLNQDEGWYLLAAREMAAGAWPFRDFFFTQGPVMPAIYSVAEPMVSRWGVLAGRILTAALGFLSIAASASLAHRFAPDRVKWVAGWAAFLLAGLSCWQAYFFSIIKTYSLSSLLLVLGLHAWLSGLRNKGSVGAPLAGLLLATAAGVRLSLGIVLLPCGLALLWHRRRLGDGPWIWFGLAGLVGLLAVFGPFMLTSPEALRFGLLDFHAARELPAQTSALLLKAGFISRMVQGQFPVTLLTAAIVLVVLFRPLAGIRAPLPAGLVAAWTMLLLVTAVHIAAPFPYDDYQAVIGPLWCALAATTAARWFDRYASASLDSLPVPHRAPAAFLTLVLLASLAAAGASPINQDMAVIGRDRIWWRFKSAPDLVRLEQAATVLRAWHREDPEALFFTQDAYLAVQAGIPVPRELTMGVFSYFPEMPTEMAARLHVLNEESMRELLRRPKVRIAALSGYSFAIASPSILPVHEETVHEFRTLLSANMTESIPFTDFGHASTRLTLSRSLTPTTAPPILPPQSDNIILSE